MILLNIFLPRRKWLPTLKAALRKRMEMRHLLPKLWGDIARAMGMPQVACDSACFPWVGVAPAFSSRANLAALRRKQKGRATADPAFSGCGFAKMRLFFDHINTAYLFSNVAIAIRGPDGPGDNIIDAFGIINGNRIVCK